MAAAPEPPLSGCAALGLLLSAFLSAPRRSLHGDSTSKPREGGGREGPSRFETTQPRGWWRGGTRGYGETDSTGRGRSERGKRGEKAGARVALLGFHSCAAPLRAGEGRRVVSGGAEW
ncbi:hypothetical protein SRHO_G00266370 [Serrasalmus rhombeus]